MNVTFNVHCWYIFLPKEDCERKVWCALNRVNLSLPVSCRTPHDGGSSEGWWEHGSKGRSSPKVEGSRLYPVLLEASFGIDRNRGKKKTSSLVTETLRLRRPRTQTLLEAELGSFEPRL